MPGEVIPLRPLTLAELLDVALELLRRNATGLLGAAAVLAVLEQAALYPLRVAAGVRPANYFDLDHLYTDLGVFWILLATGLGTEMAIIAVLGGLAGRAAVPALVGGDPAPRWLAGREIGRAHV